MKAYVAYNCNWGHLATEVRDAIGRPMLASKFSVVVTVVGGGCIVVAFLGKVSTVHSHLIPFATILVLLLSIYHQVQTVKDCVISTHNRTNITLQFFNQILAELQRTTFRLIPHQHTFRIRIAIYHPRVTLSRRGLRKITINSLRIALKTLQIGVITTGTRHTLEP